MSSVIGSIGNLRSLNKRLQRLASGGSLQLAERLATRAARMCTGYLTASFKAGLTVYDDSRPDGVNGFLTLVKSGATLGALYFVAIGTIVRASLGTKYAKYLIGKYKILPPGNATMPSKWRESIRLNAKDVLDRAMYQGEF